MHGSFVFVLVNHREEDIGEELEGAERGEQPVEVVDVAAVQVVGEPALAPRRRRPVDGRHERAADEAADAEDAEVEREPEGAQLVGHLVVEELLQPDHSEHVRGAEQHVLRHHPPQAHRQRDVGLVDEAGVPRDAEPARLDERRDHNGQEGEEHPRADALQHGDPGRLAGVPARHRHDDAVVDRDEHHDGDADEALQRGRRHLEMIADAPVQGRRLLREERRRLRERHGVDQARRPYREETEDGLGLLDEACIAHHSLILLVDTSTAKIDMKGQQLRHVVTVEHLVQDRETPPAYSDKVPEPRRLSCSSIAFLRSLLQRPRFPPAPPLGESLGGASEQAPLGVGDVVAVRPRAEKEHG
jgi:hypothetical protein